MPQKEKDELKAKAFEAVEKGNYADAEEFLKQSAKESIEETASTFFELGKIKKLQFKYVEALDYFELAVKIDPENSKYSDEVKSVINYLQLYDTVKLALITTIPLFPIALLIGLFNISKKNNLR